MRRRRHYRQEQLESTPPSPGQFAAARRERAGLAGGEKPSLRGSRLWSSPPRRSG
ncbi:MAG: hypothetical protein M0C28_29675 [Candidatus Moduliflexus flocculans]|nr:hypothetical protein [Candidatus Moduliflexus flocculans]